ncbi:coiled-coil domain-containing protein 115 [Anthonomus grandis grandis]|uniref:coiled-coil domain-containing protein 115 n=1 Tax=Anthonomus grandis grandis TaxID=2921223 RepID=UPI00216643DC|nr:coiled-coil domain-containing protein 115 [Anthonomus grandis grandis]
MTINEENLDQICQTLDKLALDALTLIQEEIEIKINAENAMIGGENHLAKTRYILGQNSVSSLQLPTENSNAKALTKVHTITDNYGLNQFDLESNKPDNEEFINPIKWFGFMPPQNLHFAQNLYRQALQWIIQAANVQNKLCKTQEQIMQLKELKKEILTREK